MVFLIVSVFFLLLLVGIVVRRRSRKSRWQSVVCLLEKTVLISPKISDLRSVRHRSVRIVSADLIRGFEPCLSIVEEGGEGSLEIVVFLTHLFDICGFVWVPSRSLREACTATIAYKGKDPQVKRMLGLSVKGTEEDWKNERESFWRSKHCCLLIKRSLFYS